ncbi:MAG TPA: protein translocase subunit SecD [bacterium]|nr:protein translocase subunit SecD [bacterium]
MQKYEKSEPMVLRAKPELTGERLTKARIQYDDQGIGGRKPIVAIEFDDEGAELFSTLTAANFHKQLAIVLDGKVMSAPSINAHIANGKAVIEGDFTQDYANDLRIILESGSLPAPVNIVENRTIGPTLGKESIRKGVLACAVGLLIVFAFMFSYYRFGGFVACLALILNIVLLLGGMAMMHATLTLPGIAGIILTIGMAVDANVLIFERMREELRIGKTIRAAVSAGYEKALSAIIDSNVTTVISAIILYQFGSGPIKGFAVTLAWGLVASMFTAIFVTRVLFEAVLRNPNVRTLSVGGKELMRLYALNIDFVAHRWKAITASVVLLVVGIASIVGHRGLNYGIDFVGGTKIIFRFATPVTTAEEDAVRDCLDAMQLGGSVQNYEENGILIQTKGAKYTDKMFESLLAKKLKADKRFDNEEAVRTTLQPFATLDVAETLLKSFYVNDTTGERIDLNTVSDANLKSMIEKGLGEELANKVKLAIAARLGVVNDSAVSGRLDANTLGDSVAFLAALQGGAAELGADALMARQGQFKAMADADAVLQAANLPAGLLNGLVLLTEPTVDDTIRFNLNTMTRPELVRVLASAVRQGGTAGELTEAAQQLAKVKERSSGMLADLTPLVGALEAPLAKAVVTQRWQVLPFMVESVEMVGPRIGADLRTKALYAIIYSIIAMLLYLAIRFQFKYGVAAVIALAHDVLITVGFMSLLGREFEMTVIAALLTLVGFSVNDTVVIFDRIREKLRIEGSKDWKATINKAINETLSRTIITSLTVFFTTISLLLLGSAVTFDFALVMTIGLFVGSYSTIFIAAPILIEWHSYFEAKRPVR